MGLFSVSDAVGLLLISCFRLLSIVHDVFACSIKQVVCDKSVAFYVQ